jgi:hypothetical protein
LSFGYAALKPSLNPQGIGSDDNTQRFVDPLPLVRLLLAGRVGDAVSIAQRLARGAGLPAPFNSLNPAPVTAPARLVAALLFPIAPKAYGSLIGRAYPNLIRDEEEIDAA